MLWILCISKLKNRLPDPKEKLSANSLEDRGTKPFGYRKPCDLQNHRVFNHKGAFLCSKSILRFRKACSTRKICFAVHSKSQTEGCMKWASPSNCESQCYS